MQSTISIDIDEMIGHDVAGAGKQADVCTYEVMQSLPANKLGSIAVGFNLEDAFLGEAANPAVGVVTVGCVRILCKDIFDREPLGQ